MTQTIIFLALYNFVFYCYRLRDDSAQVRKNTCMVLTHLILNDMVKVKGQISELASCVVDHDSRIANLSKLFFSELSKKVGLKDKWFVINPFIGELRLNRFMSILSNYQVSIIVNKMCQIKCVYNFSFKLTLPTLN